MAEEYNPKLAHISAEERRFAKEARDRAIYLDKHIRIIKSVENGAGVLVHNTPAELQQLISMGRSIKSDIDGGRTEKAMRTVVLLFPKMKKLHAKLESLKAMYQKEKKESGIAFPFFAEIMFEEKKELELVKAANEMSGTSDPLSQARERTIKEDFKNVKQAQLLFNKVREALQGFINDILLAERHVDHETNLLHYAKSIYLQNPVGALTILSRETKMHDIEEALDNIKAALQEEGIIRKDLLRIDYLIRRAIRNEKALMSGAKVL